jgi:hypothetical protein
MISKSLFAATGSGIRKLLVAPAALDAIKGTERRITVIVPHMVVADANWRQSLPDATFVTPHAWLRRAADSSTDLIIVDELHDVQMGLIKATLEAIEAEVWLVNPHNEGKAPLYRVNTGVLTDGINPPDVSGFITGNGDSSFVPHDFEGWGPLAIAAAQGFDVLDIPRSRPAPIFMTDSPPCAGFAKPLKLGTIQRINRPARAARASARASFKMYVAKEAIIQSAAKRFDALARGAIMTITTDELDQLLAPYMSAGLLRTNYEPITRATEYRGPSGHLIALTNGKRHFCRRVDGPMRSIGLYMQMVGRIKRLPRTLHAFLENPLTGQKIEGSDFTIENKTGSAVEANAEQLGIYNSYRTAKGLPPVTTWMVPR